MPVQMYRLEDAATPMSESSATTTRTFSASGLKSTSSKHSSSPSATAKGLYILCDGMGGHDGGEIASQFTLKPSENSLTSWENQLPTAETIREGVLLANQAIFEINQKDCRSGSKAHQYHSCRSLSSRHKIRRSPRRRQPSLPTQKGTNPGTNHLRPRSRAAGDSARGRPGNCLFPSRRLSTDSSPRRETVIFSSPTCSFGLVRRYFVDFGFRRSDRQ